MRSRKIRKQKFVKIYLQEPSESCPKGRFVRVRCKNASKPVTINGTLQHALDGEPGSTIGCHLSVCTMANADAFPHPCLLAAYSQSRTDIVSKLGPDGLPSECVRYQHHYGEYVELNDIDKHKEFIRANPHLAERPFTLGAILTKKRQIKQRVKGQKKMPVATGGFRKSFIPKGALKRAVDAGIISRAVAKAMGGVK